MKNPSEDDYRERAETLLRGISPRRARHLMALHNERRALDVLEGQYKGAAEQINDAAEKGQKFVIVKSYRAKSLASILIAVGLPAKVLSRNRVHVDLRKLQENEGE